MKFSNTVLAITLVSGSYVHGATASRLNLKSSLLTALVLLSNEVQNASGQYFPFVQMSSEGRCVGTNGSSNQYHPWVEKQFGLGFLSRSDPQPCIEWCTTANQEKLVGVNVYGYNGYGFVCACSLDDTIGVSNNDYDGSYNELFTADRCSAEIGYTCSASGNVEGVDDTADVDCYVAFSCLVNYTILSGKN